MRVMVGIVLMIKIHRAVVIVRSIAIPLPILAMDGARAIVGIADLPLVTGSLR